MCRFSPKGLGIERLGRIYLLKIRQGNNFASDAGNAWRLIFVLTLFPWLRQYRVKARNVASSDERRVKETRHKVNCSAFFDCFD
mmetsp:Transcript_2270/g.3370  ORF Transcript_2270/g.3370 Transcript_2270/m.3370 type:complete len:84 (-) Transcript_2270:557-808(-)